MIKSLEKLSPELLSFLRKDKDIRLAQTLAQAAKFVQSKRSELSDQFDVQILQYGPDTTIGELIPMAREEKPVPMTWKLFLGWFR